METCAKYKTMKRKEWILMSVVAVVFYGFMKTATVYDFGMAGVVAGIGAIAVIAMLAASKFGLVSSYRKRSVGERVFGEIADIVIFAAWIYIYVFTDNRYKVEIMILLYAGYYIISETCKYRKHARK